MNKTKTALLITLILTPTCIITLWYFSCRSSSNVEYFPFVRLKRKYFVEMSDGVKLATDVYLPLGIGPFPAILYRTPYGKNQDNSLALFFVSNRIAFIVQDHRGCHESEGNYTAFGSDGQDALDTVNWMKNQSWFNGIYATLGASATGITQYMQVPYLDDVAFQAIGIATPDLVEHAFFQGGAPRKMLAENWLNSIGHGDLYELIFEYPLNSTLASDYRIDENEWGNVTWPSIHMGGWYDCFQQGILDGFMGYQYKGGIGGAYNAKLIMGPWTHNVFSRRAGEIIYPENASNSAMFFELIDMMLNEKLLNIFEDDYRTVPNVTYYIMGDITQNSSNWNRWAISEEWPIPYENHTYYLQPDQSLNTTTPTTAKNFNYLYNPQNPVETRGGCNLLDPRGPYDQSFIEDGREDVLQYDFNITNTPFTIIGRIWGHLFIKSNCSDTDFTMKLIDVYPDGREMLVNDGIVRMRYRDGLNESKLMDSSGNTIYEAYIDLWSTAYVFNVGHKLRISISSSNYPRFDVNPNTGNKIEPVTVSTPTLVANNTIIVSPLYNSSIILPVPTIPLIFI